MDNNIQNNTPSFPYKLERLQVQSRQKEEALRRIETQELMLYMVNQPSRYHPHVFTSGCIIIQDGGSGGGKFVALGDLGFLSLYRLSDSRHQILGLSKTGFTRPSGLRFGRILYPEASPRNSP